MQPVDISYIVPVYNAMPYLKKCVSSLVGQTYPAERVELIFVDDGSSDGSGEFLDEQAALHRNMQVVHTPPSGGPGRPRNIGLDRAQGEYVFFCDADDWMEPDATEAMLAHAKEWGSDVLLVRPKGENGRTIPKAFAETQSNVDVYASGIEQAMGPCKLFRYEFLRGNKLGFITTLSVWEDQPFVLKSYLLADTVSVASDRIYAHIVKRDDEGNAVSLRDSAAFDDVMQYLSCMFDVFEAHADVERAKIVLIPRVLREGLFYAARSLAKEPESVQEELFARLHSRVLPYVGEGCYRMFNVQRSLALKAFEAGDMRSWMAICAVEPGPDSPFSASGLEFDEAAETATCSWGQYEVDVRGCIPIDARVVGCRWRSNGAAQLQGTIDAHAAYGLSRAWIRLNPRNAAESCDFEVELNGPAQEGRTPWLAAVDFSQVQGLGAHSIWDAHFVFEYSNGRQRKNRCRVDDAACEGLSKLYPVEPSLAMFAYATKNNSFSFWNPLMKAQMVVSRSHFGATACVKGVPKRAFELLGGLTVLLVSGKHSKECCFGADEEIKLGLSLRNIKSASVVVSGAGETVLIPLPVEVK